MKLSAHLRLSRHGVYYFRYIIPKVLRPLYYWVTDPRTLKLVGMMREVFCD